MTHSPVSPEQAAFTEAVTVADLIPLSDFGPDQRGVLYVADSARLFPVVTYDKEARFIGLRVHERDAMIKSSPMLRALYPDILELSTEYHRENTEGVSGDNHTLYPRKEVGRFDGPVEDIHVDSTIVLEGLLVANNEYVREHLRWVEVDLAPQFDTLPDFETYRREVVDMATFLSRTQAHIAGGILQVRGGKVVAE